MLSLQVTRHSSPVEVFSRDSRDIDSLPDELLCEIFGLLWNDWSPGGWCRVLWVCRRWSAVGRSAATLWSNITIKEWSNSSFIAASLKYSKNAYLNIHFFHAFLYSRILPLLSPHIHRIRVLKISASDSEERDLAAFLNNDFPCLEIFEESMSLTEGSVTWRPDASGYPRLHRLSLEASISIEVAPSAVFSALRRLDLSYQSNPAFTLSSFVQFLSRHIHIEALSLDGYRPALEGSFATLTFPSTIRRFKFTDNTGYIRDFLSAFTHIPAHVYLSITRHCDEPWAEVATNTALFVARMLPEAPQRRFHVIPRVSSLRIECHPGFYYNLVGRADPEDTTSLIELNSFFPLKFSWDTPFQRLANVTQVFAGAPITEVCFWGDCDPHPPPPAAEWVAFLDTFPLLEHIGIEDISYKRECDMRPGLLEALLAPSMDGRTRWPRLRRLTLTSGDWEYRNEALLADLLPRVLRHRAQQGAKVAEVCLIFKHKVWKGGIEDKVRLASEVVERAVWKDIVDVIRVKFVRPATMAILMSNSPPIN